LSTKRATSDSSGHGFFSKYCSVNFGNLNKTYINTTRHRNIPVLKLVWLIHCLSLSRKNVKNKYLKNKVMEPIQGPNRDSNAHKIPCRMFRVIEIIQ
jgi:hypothetical protein